MLPLTRHRWLGVLLLLGFPAPLLAHTFGRMYNLPVPVWMYLYGSAAALAFSFVIIAWLARADSEARSLATRDVSDKAAIRALLMSRPLLRLFTFSMLVLCIATGLWGTVNAYTNFSMTWFWVIFVLGFSYFVVFAGDIYPALNPWLFLSELLGRLWSRFTTGLFRYPRQLGYWPALVLYMVFIWIELLGQTGPVGLGVMLSAYTLLNVVGVLLVGTTDWFRYCEFFGVFFRLIAAMAPFERTPDGRVLLRAPCAGLIRGQVEDIGLLVFILFMLSSTAFDGLRETVPWARLFWVDFYNLIKPWTGDSPIAAYRIMKPIYQGWTTFVLVASPFLYLGVYLLFIALMRRLTDTTLGVRDLALKFGLSLLPIALVYHVTHYYTLFLTQGPKIIGLASDPFGWRWNLFGTLEWLRRPVVLEPGTIWHTQLALIVGGHVVSVYVAHLIAMRLFGDRRQAAISQLPMLVLMMLFTAFGLWILAQPIQGG